MSIFEFIEDYDNPILEFVEWREQMIEAVKEYNEKNGTIHDPGNIISRYQWSKEYDKWNKYE